MMSNVFILRKKKKRRKEEDNISNKKITSLFIIIYFARSSVHRNLCFPSFLGQSYRIYTLHRSIYLLKIYF